MSRYGRMNRHHQSTDSDGLSLGTSPPPSPRHPVYFVQSPSRDSFYGETPTPGRSQELGRSHELGRARDMGRSREFRSGELHRSQDFSPMDSPLNRSFARASPAYSDSDTRAFATQTNSHAYDSAGNPTKSTPRKLGGSNPSAKKGYTPWNPAVTVIEEEEQESEPKPMKKLYIYMLWALVFICVFFVAILILWLITRPGPPTVSIKNVSLQQFTLGSGQDDSGVPTSLLTVNLTATLELHNPSRFLSMDYNTLVLQLFFQELDVADGNIPGFSQGKRSTMSDSLVLHTYHNTIHGAGASLESLDEAKQDMPFVVVGTVRSSAQVFWKFIRPKFENNLKCPVFIHKIADNQYDVNKLTQPCVASH
eukprot:TRINITY_DN24611_c0_g1_i1.p2 TRINITY_DN24611_c0_g1~~TRINITY_DN24611_c0_g1_i1.p2  ORF type:complete len:365 (+),score=29.12 TRINITY_DN24611_c0_g1_i1:610-1704(+)